MQTSKGELRCSDAGVYSIADPSGPNVELCTITGGTGDWAGVSGSIRLHGTFTFAAGGDAEAAPASAVLRLYTLAA